MSKAPKATVITAAYNRSNILYYAIESVRRQTLADWEMIIVGDHCTDDSEAVAKGFGDPRITFLNLPENTGGQSAPNNKALEMARGDYIFYLNQDDFYFPDHLESSIAFLEKTGSDIVWCAVASPDYRQRHAEDLSEQNVVVGSATGSGEYDPAEFIVASCWAMRRSAAERTGRWKSGEETTWSPSQEYLFRASRKGCSLKFHRKVSVVGIFSGLRRNSYALREDAETAHYFKLIFDTPGGREHFLQQIAITQGQYIRSSEKLTGDQVRLAFWHLILEKLSLLLGRHPRTLLSYFQYKKDKGFLSSHRKTILGSAEVGRGDLLKLGEKEADALLGGGWAGPEGTHRWSVAPRVQLSINVKADRRPAVLRLVGSPLVSQRVTFTVGGEEIDLELKGMSFGPIDLPLPPDQDRIVLGIAVERMCSASKAGVGVGDTPLGFCLQTVELR
jgi:glycosyltransferase involved in cell wall biosynthesis